jgi:hypothetical protein
MGRKEVVERALRAKKENDFLLLDKKRAREGDVVATVKDLQQITHAWNVWND